MNKFAQALQDANPVDTQAQLEQRLRFMSIEEILEHADMVDEDDPLAILIQLEEEDE